MRIASDLWPVAAVWLLMVLPYLAYTAPALRRNLDPMPWWLGAMLWCLQRTWPYSKAFRLGAILDRWPYRSDFGPLRPRYREEQLELFNPLRR